MFIQYFLIFQPVSWELPVGKLHTWGVQQCLPYVHLLHRQWEVQRECPSLGGKTCSTSSKIRLPGDPSSWWDHMSYINTERSCLLLLFKPMGFLQHHFIFWCVSGVQEGAQPFPILLQMCDGSRSGRWWSWPHSEGTNRAAGLPGPLFQQSGVYHYTDFHMSLWECYEFYAAVCRVSEDVCFKVTVSNPHT